MIRTPRTALTAMALLVFVCAAAFPLAAFAKNDKSAAADTATAVSGKAKSGTIDGFTGGTVKCSKWTVVVPPGAFRGTATITITERGADKKTVDLAITPESLNAFLVPVKLQYKKTDVAENVGAESIYWWNPATLAWEPAANQAGDPANGTLSAGLLHFSTYSIFGTRAGW